MKQQQTARAKVEPEKLDQAALQAFFSIVERWRLGAEQARVLLGCPAASTFFKWKKEHAGHLSQDTRERISYVVGIYKALHVLLPAHQADAWVKKPNRAPLFSGQSALDRMLAGRVVDLADVRRYLDAERGW
jgi:uncharacterized protein (DUF2384 family)